MTAVGLGGALKLKKARGEYPIAGSTGCCARADIAKPPHQEELQW